VPPAIWLITSTSFKHAIGQAGKISCQCLTGVVFSHTVSQEPIVILVKRIIVAADDGHRSQFVDCLECMIEPGLTPPIAASATEFFVLDQTAVAQVV